MSRFISDNNQLRRRTPEGYKLDPLIQYNYRNQSWKDSPPDDLTLAVFWWLTTDITRQLAYIYVQLQPEGIGYAVLTKDDVTVVIVAPEHPLVWAKGQSNAPVFHEDEIMKLWIWRPHELEGGYYFRTRWY